MSAKNSYPEGPFGAEAMGEDAKPVAHLLFPMPFIMQKEFELKSLI